MNEDVKEVGTANTTDATTEPQNFNQGIQIPQDTAAFEKFENTDPKTLNEDVKEVGTAGAVPSESSDLDKTKNLTILLLQLLLLLLPPVLVLVPEWLDPLPLHQMKEIT